MMTKRLYIFTILYKYLLHLAKESFLPHLPFNFHLQLCQSASFRQMFPHLKERLILTDKLNQKGKVADNVAVINATDLSPMIENTLVKEIREVVVPDAKNKPVEISLKVAELPTTTPIETMIASGQCQMSVNGVVVQNGMATTQVNNKTATGEEVPQNIVITTRQQYGLPEDAVVYCNFNQLYKIDPLTLHMWAHVSSKLKVSLRVFLML